MPKAPPESRVGGRSCGYVSGSCPLDSYQDQLTKCGIAGNGVADAADDRLEQSRDADTMKEWRCACAKSAIFKFAVPHPRPDNYRAC